MAKGNKELKDSLKNVTFKKEALEQRVAFIENKVALLQEERMINTSLMEELARYKENTPSFSRKRTYS